MTRIDKLKPFIPIPRSVAREFKDGVINRNELMLYLWMRINADPYGNYTASIPALRDDILQKTSDNYVNKLLLSLRSKKYIHFQNHRGRRGSFEVKFGDFITPNGTITTIVGDPNTKQIANPNTAKPSNNSNVGQNLDPLSQKFQEDKNKLHKGFSFDSPSPEVRTHYNDNDKENEN